ncbi:hypothetical protein ACFP2T_39260 [Plantactinospora solaniradicis]|uniref:WXG100 family type VII secretion target n=1 Tax=Plantactinospora solaniradicis TaxID=1723736 RepID=A0ABW1KK53_9ACTN
MTDWIRADFAALGGLRQGITATGAGFTDEHDSWSSVVEQLVQDWPDAAGGLFNAVTVAALTFDRVNNEFLGMLGVAVEKALELYEGTLADVSKMIPDS